MAHVDVTSTHEPLASGRESHLVVLSHDPFNAETALRAPVPIITPNRAFFVRSHDAVPRVEGWRLSVRGEVRRPIDLDYETLRRLPTRTLVATLECAGNGRHFMRPTPPGEPWGRGAVSTARWTGVSLNTVLELAGLGSSAIEIVFVGDDLCDVGAGARVPFARSLPIAKALDPDTLLAFGMNDAPLPLHHGHPLRLIVPGWYGVACVKWLRRIEALAQPFRGYFQSERYVIVPADRARGRVEPVTTMLPRSVITSPADGDVVPRGEVRVTGLAWSGAGDVVRVEVSADGGTTWAQGTFTSPAERHAWRAWSHVVKWLERGPVTLASRAFDSSGRTQPYECEWNRFGYQNNAIERVNVAVR
jgi:DMSO/TMAO reductase YedYZ molybdopterin-dependent catalytic subunit